MEASWHSGGDLESRHGFFAQQTCPNGIRIDGVVTDPTGALIAGAQIQGPRRQQGDNRCCGAICALLCVRSL